MSKIRDTSRFFGSAEADMILVDAHTQRRPGRLERIHRGDGARRAGAVGHL